MPPKLVSGPAPRALRRRLLPPTTPSPIKPPVSREQYFVSPSPRTLAQPRPDIIHGPQLTRESPTLFSQTGFRPSVSDPLDGGSNRDHEPPDERILKLGKSGCSPNQQAILQYVSDADRTNLPQLSASSRLSSPPFSSTRYPRTYSPPA